MSSVPKVLLISLGAVVGANARYWLGVWVTRGETVTFPWTTLAINVAGSIILGLAVAWAAHSANVADTVILLLGVGFCGSFTTFSTFGFETFSLLNSGAIGSAAAYVGISLGGSIGGSAAGYSLLHTWLNRAQ